MVEIEASAEKPNCLTLLYYVITADEDMNTSLIIGSLLVVPVLLLVVITILTRMYHTGKTIFCTFN